jgi:hypothetical protein
MSLYPPDLPWMNKPAAVGAAVDLIIASALNQRGLVGYIDLASHGEGDEAGTVFWRPPRSQVGVWRGDLRERAKEFLAGGFDAPADNLDQALAFLSASRILPLGTLIFVLSDFTAALSSEPWTRAVEHGWDVVPVIVQDPVWEQSFPEISGVLVPLADPLGSRLRYVRLDAREVEERRRANEARLASLQADFLGFGLDSVLISRPGRDDVHAAFLDWAEGRLVVRGRRW